MNSILVSIIVAAFFLAFWLVVMLLKEYLVDKEMHPMIDMAFLEIVYVVYVILYPQLGWRILATFCFGLFLAGISHSFRIIVGLCSVTGLFGLLVAHIGLPIFLQIEQRGESFLFYPVFQVRIPYFYVIVPLAAVSSSLFSWLFTTYVWKIVNVMRRENMTQKKKLTFNLKSVVRYLQFIPVGLLPLIIPHALRNYTLLDEISNLLGFLCISMIYFIPFSLLIVFARRKIFENPFLRVSTIFSFLSLISIFYALFEYIVLNIPWGVLIVSLCLSSLFGASLGFSIAGSIINNK